MIIAISPSKPENWWIDSLNSLFRAGLSRLHLRLPDAWDIYDYARVINGVDPNFHNRIMVCDYPDLLSQFDLAGLYYHVDQAQALTPEDVEDWPSFSVGAHSLQELQDLQVKPTYALLSPVFDSISKEGYKGNPALRQIQDELQQLPFPVVALGGIDANNQAEALSYGYDGIAILGGLWQRGMSPLEAFSHYERPHILSVAGLDPCAGAGLLADANVAQTFNVGCYAVPSCLTVQNAQEFVSSSTTSSDYQAQALDTLLEVHPASVAKIGMMPSIEAVLQTAKTLKSHGVKTIVWDPILHATHAQDSKPLLKKGSTFEQVLDLVDLATPNLEECATLFGTLDDDGLMDISERHHCNILLKGGHATSDVNLVTDSLYLGEDAYDFTSHRSPNQVHGSGCMLSAAIAALLAHGNSYLDAVQKAQHYIEEVFRRNGRSSATTMGTIERRRSLLSQCGELQYITNSPDEATILSNAKAFLEGGGRWIQLRMKDASTARIVEVGLKLHALCQQYRAVLIVDDDINAVKAIGAEGVHLGPEDTQPTVARWLLGPHYIIGRTVNDLPSLIETWNYSVDYLGIGPFKKTKTKTKHAKPLGLKTTSMLTNMMGKLSRCAPGHLQPLLVAIGGIDVKDVEDLLSEAHVNGVAVSGAIERSKNISLKTRKFIEALTPPPPEDDEDLDFNQEMSMAKLAELLGVDFDTLFNNKKNDK